MLPLPVFIFHGHRRTRYGPGKLLMMLKAVVCAILNLFHLFDVERRLWGI